MSPTLRRPAAGLLATALGMLVACGGGAADQPASAVPTSTAPVIRTDIVSRRQLNGTLGYAGAIALTNELGPGVYTDLPQPGAVIARGETLYRVDDRPVALLYGTPGWRSLSVGVADGPDVIQLEQNLLALGFANSTNLIANGHFDSFDAAAVRRWQASRGVTQSGIVEFGDVIYETGAVRVAVVNPVLGTPAQPGQRVIEATTTKHVVLVALDTGDEGSVKAGDPVMVTLPDGTTVVPGTVTDVGSVATAAASNGQGAGAGPAATVAVTISLTDPGAGARFDLTPVSVGVVDTVHQGVLAVPLMALLAQTDGTYAVIVVGGSQRRAVAVTTGLFDDRGLVEVAGPDLHEGMLVEVPET